VGLRGIPHFVRDGASGCHPKARKRRGTPRFARGDKKGARGDKKWLGATKKRARATKKGSSGWQPIHNTFESNLHEAPRIMLRSPFHFRRQSFCLTF